MAVLSLFSFFFISWFLTSNLSSDTNMRFWTEYGTDNPNYATRYSYTVCMNDENCNSESGMATYWEYTNQSGPKGICRYILGYFNETNKPYYYSLNEQDHWVFFFGTTQENNQFTVNWRCNKTLSASKLVTYTGDYKYMTFYMDSPNACS
eukprot:167084_1